MKGAARLLLVASLFLFMSGLAAKASPYRFPVPWPGQGAGAPGASPVLRGTSPSARPVRSPRPLTADQAATAFFDAVHARRFREAYDFLAPGVQRDLSYEDFELHSREVKSVKVIELVATERARSLVRFRVKGRLRIVYEGQLFEAIYGGRACMTRVGSKWCIDEVDLKPLEQRPVKKGSPGYRI